MAEKNPAKTFGNETHDDCKDDARTEQNREGAPKTDGAENSVYQKARNTSSDEPPTREPNEGQ